MYASTLLAILACGSSLVSGHGMVKNIKINGKTYPGASGPGADPSNSPVRAISTGDPIDDVNSPMMLCGRDSKPAPISAKAKPGDKVDIAWQGETGINWFHNVGPVQTYMAKCTGDCSSFTPSSSTKWFKIDALGLLPGSDSTWYQSKMNDGATLPVTIPSDLPNGNYLMRHEILALQNGQSKDLAEFYPNCIQMTISGGLNANANGTPSPTTTFPGAYKDTDPGILVNVYNPGLKYVMPGPRIADIAKGSSSNSGNPPPSGDDPSSSSAPVNAAPTPTEASSSAPEPTSTHHHHHKGSGQCRKHKSSSGNAKRALRAHAKRRMVKAY